MYQSNRMYALPESKMSDLINDNPALLLLMEHFDLNFNVHEKSVEQICMENKLPISVFLSFCNLYNGFPLEQNNQFEGSDIDVIIRFLKNCHVYYKQDKYPEIQQLIVKLYENNSTDVVKLIEHFFDEYFSEVNEHLNYEESIAFPYFQLLLDNTLANNFNSFSVKKYREHHSDIESKLTDLKNLILKHVNIENDYSIRRKLLFSLYDLEFDLEIHSLIEEFALMPIVEKIESNRK